ncbi:hypothetical protein E2C01_074405 [Portunus trituberculatus]|uniref:Uncharacterized protein n=1 Tax=Portunus trituberculatus TaxID=210409 RepID=A0A5B7IC24_PORTR|nr:hypothetical protein [Portunus trituberculatus]
MVEEEKGPKIVKTLLEEVDEAEEKGLSLPPSQCNDLLRYRSLNRKNGAIAAIKMSTTQRCRAHSKTLAVAWKAAIANDNDSNEEPQAPERTPLWPAPYVEVHGSDGCALVPEASEATATHGDSRRGENWIWIGVLLWS